MCLAHKRKQGGTTPRITRFKPETNTHHNPARTKKSGAEMHRALPPPFFEIKKCVYRYDFGVTVDDAICFKTSYSLGAPWMTPFVLKQVIL